MDASDFMLYTTAYVSLFVSIFWFLIYFSSSDRKKTVTTLPGMSIMVPAYNEEKTITGCILSLLKQNYDGLKIIVIDDGSTDKTGEIVQSLAKQHHNIQYIRKKQGGKASALNFGLRHIYTELCGFVDSDTYLSRGALRNMVGYMHDNVVSVTICIKPVKTKSMIQKLQRVEYMIASFTRKLMSYINSVYYTPGFAIYKTDVLKKVGGFDEHNLTEDLEIGLRLKDKGYDIENTIEKYAYTEVPKTFSELFEQRMRWYRGFIYNSRKYKHMFFNKNFGDMGLLVLPMQYILLAIITPFILYGIYSFLVSLVKYTVDAYLVGFDINYILLTSTFNWITPTTFFVVAVLAAYLFMLGISHKKTEETINLKTYVVYIILYPFINTILWLSAFSQEITGTKKKW